MRRNILLVLAIFVGLLLAYNSAKRIASYRGTSQKVADAAARLDSLRQENAKLKQELAYKQSEKFVEGEIRDKLGLAKPGEQVFVVPKSDNSQSTIDDGRNDEPNWQKWRDYLFGGE